jgi:hypothetical protein
MAPLSNGSPEVSAFFEPVVRATCKGIPVYSYGYTNILGESPDLVEDARVQANGDTTLYKAPLKKSWEITSNRLGTDTPGMPRTPANDYLPLEAIHLIDGDPQTCWSSRMQPQPDVEPVWIRLDLPMERTIHKIVLRKRPPGAKRNMVGSVPPEEGAVEVGMGMPAELTIKVSRDARHWEVVFEGESGDAPDQREFVYEFTACPAKQIWIIGRNLPRVENWLFAFSIADVEVYDTEGNNVALATRGTGVTVSSTQHAPTQEIEAHRWFWPLHCDLGLKWVRMGHHDDPINWHWVERERGKLRVDPGADAAITYLAERGIDVVMALGFGNRLYTQPDPARKLPQLWEWYYENPKPPTTPEALEAWARYVRFMATHFRDRVRYFELWNEWNIAVYWGAEPNLEQYFAVAHTAIPILREVCPDAKVVLGGVSGYGWRQGCEGMSTCSPEELAAREREAPFLRAIREFAREVDVISWHPIYQTDPELSRCRTYIEDVRALQSYCAAQGFRGEYMASEWAYGADYPAPAPPNWWGDFVCSEIEKAKYVAQLTVAHTALGVGSFFCTTWNSYYPLDLSLLRRTFSADPISPQQPQAAYYVMRNLATALDELEPAEFSFRVNGGPEDMVTFALARRGERVLALWRSGRTHDHCAGKPCDVLLDGRYESAIGNDPLNGTAQELRVHAEGDRTCVPGILVKDYPILIRLKD